ncbi:MAG: hypothetical protein U0Q18_04060 [Bryobacteraceae bacterium]
MRILLGISVMSNDYAPRLPLYTFEVWDKPLYIVPIAPGSDFLADGSMKTVHARDGQGDKSW